MKKSKPQRPSGNSATPPEEKGIYRFSNKNETKIASLMKKASKKAWASKNAEKNKK